MDLIIKTLCFLALILIGLLLRKGLKIMADGLTDLKQAVVDLNTSFTAEVGAIATALQNANQGGVSQADAEAVVTNMKSLQALIDAKTAELLTPPQPA